MGLPLTPPDIEVLDGRKLGLSDVSTILCSELQSDAEQLPYQAVMQPVKMLSMVQLEILFEHLRSNAKSFQPPEGK